jgi:hypothetical protein
LRSWFGKLFLFTPDLRAYIATVWGRPALSGLEGTARGERGFTGSDEGLGSEWTGCGADVADYGMVGVELSSVAILKFSPAITWTRLISTYLLSGRRF